MGFSTGSCLVGPPKVRACDSVLFTKRSIVVWNKEHLVDFVVTLCTIVMMDVMSYSLNVVITIADDLCYEVETSPPRKK